MSVILGGKVYVIRLQANLAHMAAGNLPSHTSSMKQPRVLTLPIVWDVSSYPAPAFWGLANAIAAILDILQIKHGGFD